MADDRLTAELEAIDHRAAVAFDWRTGPNENLMRAIAGDVRLLRAALDVVLKDHQPGRIVIFGALCKRHENHGYFSITSGSGRRPGLRGLRCSRLQFMHWLRPAGGHQMVPGPEGHHSRADRGGA